MALIQCRECGGQISDKAPACPKCGCPAESPVVFREERDASIGDLAKATGKAV